jgi:glyoxylase-like metal-dependent hydrolase (beta-lactamase superfamily II)
VRVTGTAQRDAWLAHAFPPVEQAGPDLWSVPVPIPDSPLRYTLTYLVAAGSGLVVVDPGWDTEAGRISSRRRADGFEDLCLRGAGQGGGIVR